MHFAFILNLGADLNDHEFKLYVLNIEYKRSKKRV